MENKIQELKRGARDCEQIIKNIEGLLERYKHNYDIIKETQKEIVSNIKEMENSKVRKDGVLIDYKTFSDIISVLSTAKKYGDCTEEFYDKIINMGQEQLPQTEKPKVKQASRFELEPIEKEPKFPLNGNLNTLSFKEFLDLFQSQEGVQMQPQLEVKKMEEDLFKNKKLENKDFEEQLKRDIVNAIFNGSY